MIILISNNKHFIIPTNLLNMHYILVWPLANQWNAMINILKYIYISSGFLDVLISAIELYDIKALHISPTMHNRLPCKKSKALNDFYAHV